MNDRSSVWPYFAVSLISGAVGITLLIFNLGSNIPAKEALQKISGTVDKLFIIDDLSGAKTGLMKPMNSIHFTLEESEAEFRYPSSWPVTHHLPLPSLQHTLRSPWGHLRGGLRSTFARLAAASFSIRYVVKPLSPFSSKSSAIAQA